MENEKTYLQNLILNRRIVRNYIESDKTYPDLSDIPKLTIKIPTAGFSRGIEIISVENKENIQKLAIYANEEIYIKKGFGKWISNSKAISLQDRTGINFNINFDENDLIPSRDLEILLNFAKVRQNSVKLVQKIARSTSSREI